MTRQEVREVLGAADPALVRVCAGVSLRTIAKAVGVNYGTVWRWENRVQTPRGEHAARYCRIIAGLRQHLEIDEEGMPHEPG